MRDAKREDFIAHRTERWQRLERTVQRVQSHGVRALSGDDVLELGALYRSVSSDLALARRDWPGDRLESFLNDLLARAHPVIYQERAVGRARLWLAVKYDFPVAYRRASRYTALAFALTVVAAVVAAVLVALRPSLADVLLPGEAQALRSVMMQHHLWMKSATENHSVAANFIMLNNIQVAFLALSGGMLAGTLTTYVLVNNGIMLGVVAVMVQQYGLSGEFWSFVVPHGVIELSVIFLAGGAGFLIADSMLRPGQFRRRDSLASASREAAFLLFGAVPLLMIAGTIEGFFSPSNAPDVLKIAVGCGTGVLLYTYVLRAGVRRDLPVAPSARAEGDGITAVPVP